MDIYYQIKSKAYEAFKLKFENKGLQTFQNSTKQMKICAF